MVLGAVIKITVARTRDLRNLRVPSAFSSWIKVRCGNKIVQAISVLCKAFFLLGKALCTLTACLWNWMGG
jgi:hypothetical protein